MNIPICPVIGCPMPGGQGPCPFTSQIMSKVVDREKTPGTIEARTRRAMDQSDEEHLEYFLLKEKQNEHR